jgi:hypothetical protein
MQDPESGTELPKFAKKKLETIGVIRLPVIKYKPRVYSGDKFWGSSWVASPTFNKDFKIARSMGDKNHLVMAKKVSRPKEVEVKEGVPEVDPEPSGKEWIHNSLFRVCVAGVAFLAVMFLVRKYGSR